MKQMKCKLLFLGIVAGLCASLQPLMAAESATYDPKLYGEDEPESVQVCYDSSMAVVETNDADLARFGALVVVIENAAKTDILSLEFEYPSAIAEDGLPVDGVYPIAFGDEATNRYPDNCVAAMPGIIFGYLFPSYYGVRNAGGTIENVWMMVEGELRISRQDEGYTLEVDALNSKGAAIHYTYTSFVVDDKTDAREVEQRSERPTKWLRNGHVVLRVGAKEYDILSGRLH